MAPIQDRLEHGSAAERQGRSPSWPPCRRRGRADALRLARPVERRPGPPELQLDLIEAATKRNDPEFRRKLQQYEKSKPKGDPLALYREVLAGGDAQRGMTIFTSKAAVECLRCHKVKGPTGEIAGGEVGPELSGIGARQNRTYLLESILDPNKQIAQGFESVVLATSDGKILTGVLRGEDDKKRPAHHRRGKASRRAQMLDRGAQARALGHARRPGAQAIQDRAPRPDRIPRQLEDTPKTP